MKNDKLTQAERDAIEVPTAEDIGLYAVCGFLSPVAILKLCADAVKARKMKETGHRELCQIGASYTQRQLVDDVKTLLTAVYAHVVYLTLDGNKTLQAELKGGE